MRGRKEQRRRLANVELALRIRSHVAAAPIEIMANHVTFETCYLLFIYLFIYLPCMVSSAHNDARDSTSAYR